MYVESSQSNDLERRLAWWREAKFGMFIHWGLYAIPAGVWKGKEVPGIGEWIMKRASIPVQEYEALAREFNPVQFDAPAWARLAKEAGMKYLVITAKHHDGFSMYDSKASDYDIVDRTPFGRDPMRELAEACQREGVRLCFYYSQAQDWHDPNGVGNDWDYDEEKKDFAEYFERKVKPQVRELLTQYGPVGLIWFDTPRVISKEQSEELAALVHDLQPETLVNSRVGHDVGDYLSTGDNQIPIGVLDRPWETPATINDTWGFKVNDHNWKPVSLLIRLLVDIVSKGGNYLLNVGPTAEGVIPQPSVERLRRIGEWLKRHGDAIYGAGRSPFPFELEWGAITAKPGKLYLHIFDWPKGELVLYGLKSRVKRALPLGEAKAALKGGLHFRQEFDEELGVDRLRLSLPVAPFDEHVSVAVLEIEGEVQVDPSLVQHPSGAVALEACAAQIRSDGAPTARLGAARVVERWTETADWLRWEFTLVEPGGFDVEIITAVQRRQWEGGHDVTLRIGGQEFQCAVSEDERFPSDKSPHQEFVRTKCGRVTLPKAGRYALELRANRLESSLGLGLVLRAVKLIPADRN